MTLILIVVVLLGVLVTVLWLAQSRQQEAATNSCGLCGRSFDSSEALEAHLFEHGKVSRPTFVP